MFNRGDGMNSGIFFKKGQVEISEKSPGGGVSFSKKKKTPYPAVQHALALVERKNLPTSRPKQSPRRFI